MPDPGRCPQCGGVVSGDAPEGMCWTCLLRIGLGKTAREKSPLSSGASSGDKSSPRLPDQSPAILEDAGNRIGQFKLIEKIGEGGCGIVYKAEQEAPVQRQVALKIIKLGMDTRQVVARFEAERQTLALMDHPHIAKVLDAGTTKTGRPFFVMELVQGVPITRYCDDYRLGMESRLRLFIHVCQAVQHAHQKGVIHRDIKPSNILVTEHDGKPVPKIIDFGIAKATTGQTLVDNTVFTAFEQFLGTPAYMSPEQARLSGGDIDTRSDIYSLGVLLYELLTSKTPFDAKTLLESGLDEIRRTILDTEPPRPSARLTSLDAAEQTVVATRRQSNPTKWIGTIRGDLDWIAIKCLEKDRGRRYETANGLARDIERFLNNEPITAHPPGAAYQLKKFALRNKMAVLASALVTMGLLFGVLMSARETVRSKEAEREQRRLKEQAVRAHEIAARDRARAEQRLYDSLVSEARALRAARSLGYRESVFQLIRQANMLNVPRKDISLLRTEAAGCLGDFLGLKPTTITNFPTDTYIRQTALSPAGNLIAFLLSDGNVHLRALPSSVEAGCLTGTNQIGSFCFSATGDQIFTVHLYDPNNCPDLEANRRAMIYEWVRGTDDNWNAVKKLNVPGAIRCLASTAGAYAYTLDYSNQAAYLVNLETGKTAQRIGFPKKFPDSKPFPGYPEVALSLDGRFFAAETLEAPNSENVFIDIWDLTDGRIAKRIEPGLAFLESVAFNPDASHLACLSQLGGAVYDLNKPLAGAVFKGLFISPSAPAFAPHQKLIGLPITRQSQVRLWDWTRNEDVVVLREPSSVSEVSFASSGTCLATAGRGYAQVYDLRRLPEKLSLMGHTGAVTGAAFSPDGRRLASVSTDQTVRLWDTVTGTALWGPASLPGRGQTVAYSPDGNVVATGGFKVRMGPFWNAQTGKKILELETAEGGRIWSAQFSPNGRFFASAGDYEVAIWSVSNMNQASGSHFDIHLLKSVSGPAVSLVFAPNSRYVAYLDLFGAVYVWEAEGKAEPRPLASGGRFAPQSIAFSSDSRRALIAQKTGEIANFDLASGKEVSERIDLKRSISPSVRFSLSPDETRLAVISQSGLGVEIWNPRSRELIYALPEQNVAVEWLAWSPDSGRIAVSRSNGDIDIWDMRTVEAILAQIGLGP